MFFAKYPVYELIVSCFGRKWFFLIKIQIWIINVCFLTHIQTAIIKLYILYLIKSFICNLNIKIDVILDNVIKYKIKLMYHLLITPFLHSIHIYLPLFKITYQTNIVFLIIQISFWYSFNFNSNTAYILI